MEGGGGELFEAVGAESGEDMLICQIYRLWICVALSFLFWLISMDLVIFRSVSSCERNDKEAALSGDADLR